MKANEYEYRASSYGGWIEKLPGASEGDLSWPRTEAGI